MLMQVFVDNQEYQTEGDPGQTIAQLAAEVGSAVSDKPRMVVGLTCDGQTVSQADLESTLARPAGDFQKLEMQTQPLGALIRNILGDTINLFSDADQARRQAADLLAEGKTAAAMQQLQTFFAAWCQVQDAMILCARALGDDLDNLQVRGRPIAQAFEPLGKLLKDLKDAMVSHDHVVVGDLLYYEFEAPLKEWLAILETLRDRADEQGGRE